MEAISHAGTCLGILAKDGILLAAERRNTNKLLDEGVFAEKIYKLNEYVDLLNVAKQAIKLLLLLSSSPGTWSVPWPVSPQTPTC